MNTIIIPIYYKDPTLLDRFSINSLMENLEDINEYDIHYVHPKDMDISNWKSLTTKGKEVVFDSFNKEYFLSTISYSSLLMNYNFWKVYEKYEYALLYQLDGYCIGGKLSTYIDMQYDYIGAPIIANNARWLCVPAVGNGGVSLRCIATMTETTDPNGDFLKENAEDIKKYNEVNGNMYAVFEDLYFAQLVPMLWEFKKPTFEIAAAFSYDMNVDKVYEMTGHTLPMFIHAFDKNIRFWQHILSSFNNIDIISACEWKNRNGYLSPITNYQGYIEHKNVAVGAITCVKNENWQINDFISHLIEKGFKKLILIDNNAVSGENPMGAIKSFKDFEIIYIDKYRGKKCSYKYDLLNAMYQDVYLHYLGTDLTHVMFIDADERLVSDKSITQIAYDINNAGYDMMHIPSINIDIDGNESKQQDCRCKTLVKTNLKLVSFFRETPVSSYKACNNIYEEDKSVRRKYDNYTSIKNITLYIENHNTCDSKETYNLNKKGRGWPDKDYNTFAKTLNNDYFYQYNGKANSTIEIS